MASLKGTSSNAVISSRSRRAHTLLGTGLRRRVSVRATDNQGNPVAVFFQNLFRGPEPRARVDTRAPDAPPAGLAVATVAGGCFWGLELAMQRVPGVIKTSVGYTQGRTVNPTYQEVQVYYDESECTFEALLDIFFERVNPTQKNRQGNDRGTQYRSGIYFHSDDQAEMAAERLAREASNYNRPIVVELLPAGPYYFAEKYHQQYLARGGRFGMPQSTEKGSKDKIRCYG